MVCQEVPERRKDNKGIYAKMKVNQGGLKQQDVNYKEQTNVEGTLSIIFLMGP